MAAFVWEPSLVKINAVMAAVEASCLVLSVDETISMFIVFLLRALLVTDEAERGERVLTGHAENEQSEQAQAPQRGLPPGAAQRALRGRGRGMPRR